MKKNKIVIWLIKDIKKGHEKQSIALIEAIKELTKTDVCSMKFKPIWYLVANMILNTIGRTNNFKKPDLIIGAGHATHLSIIFFKKKYGGKSIVLMKPSLPYSWFDLCFIPRHDMIKNNKTVEITNGAITKACNESNHNSNEGVIFVGGRSKHFNWKNIDVISQINDILISNQKLNIKISTSRRTPEDFVAQLKNKIKRKVKIYSHTNLDEGWFEQESKNSKYSWVTEDSISMIYELIGYGTQVTPIRLERNKSLKISNEVTRLIDSKVINSYVGLKTQLLNGSPTNEAKRCAKIVIDKWFSK